MPVIQYTSIGIGYPNTGVQFNKCGLQGINKTAAILTLYTVTEKRPLVRR